MKHLAAYIAVVLALIPSASALDRPGVIRVTSRQLYVQATTAGPVAVSSIYNTALTSRSIGNSQMMCVTLRGGGPVPYGSRYCLGSFTIGGNSIQVHGVARNPFRYQLAVVGGTGQYANVGGTLNVFRYSSRPIRERLVFVLTI